MLLMYVNVVFASGVSRPVCCGLVLSEIFTTTRVLVQLFTSVSLFSRLLRGVSTVEVVCATKCVLKITQLFLLLPSCVDTTLYPAGYGFS